MMMRIAGPNDAPFATVGATATPDTSVSATKTPGLISINQTVFSIGSGLSRSLWRFPGSELLHRYGTLLNRLPGNLHIFFCRFELPNLYANDEFSVYPGLGQVCAAIGVDGVDQAQVKFV